MTRDEIRKENKNAEKERKKLLQSRLNIKKVKENSIKK